MNQENNWIKSTPQRDYNAQIRKGPIDIEEMRRNREKRREKTLSDYLKESKE